MEWNIFRLCVFLSFSLWPYLCPEKSFGQTWIKATINLSTGDTLTTGWKASFVSADVGWLGMRAVGVGGKIFLTTDGGRNWEHKKQTRFGITRLFALDSLSAWVRPSLHWVLFTHDGGLTWDSSYVDTLSDRSTGPLLFFNRQDGIVVGKCLYVTSTGGDRWFTVNCAESSYFYSTNTIDFPDPLHGWIGGVHPLISDQGFLAITTDGGQTWQEQSSLATVPITKIDMIDSLSGYALGYSAFRSSPLLNSTTNGGKTWRLSSLNDPGLAYDMEFLNRGRGWIVGEKGKIWQTLDSGKTWQLQETGVQVNLRCISITKGDDYVYVMGDSNILLRANLLTSENNSLTSPHATFTLHQNYPNPFDSSTIIEYELSEPGEGSLNIYNYMGQLIKTFALKENAIGYKKVRWDGTDTHGVAVGTGIFLYSLRFGSQTVAGKGVLVR